MGLQNKGIGDLKFYYSFGFKVIYKGFWVILGYDLKEFFKRILLVRLVRSVNDKIVFIYKFYIMKIFEF